MNRQQVLKYSISVLSGVGLSLAIWVPQSEAQNTNPIGHYACHPWLNTASWGTVHDVSDLKGGDLAAHQTGGNPKYTCYQAFKPNGTDGKYTCSSGSLHLVSDLKGGVESQHQVGTPPRTCIQGALPDCAANFADAKTPTNGTGALSAGSVCVPVQSSGPSPNPK